MISDEDIRRVREATDLVDLVGETVVLKQKGREFWGRCPFHEEKTASFKVDPRSQLYHCFGCHASGDAYGFAMKTQSMEFIEAVRYLADRANITLTEVRSSGVSQGKRAKQFEIMAASAEFYAMQLLRSTTKEAAAARSYLSKRDMDSNVAKHWQLGFAPGYSNLADHLKSKGYTPQECIDADVVITGRNGQPRDRFYGRVMFPVADLQGRIIAFSGRVLDAAEPKYLNSKETMLFHKGETLYAIDKAKAPITNSGTAIVVEGTTDTIAMHRAGFDNTVATLGTALTKDHLRLLNRFAKKTICLFDGDEAGRRAALRVANLINMDNIPEAGKFRVSLNVAVLPAGQDPADLLASKGVEAMQEVLDNAVPLLMFAIQQTIASADTSNPEGRSAALRAALQVLLPIRGSVLANDYISGEIAPSLGVDYAAALSLFNSMKAPRTYSSETRGERSGSSAATGSSGTNSPDNAYSGEATEAPAEGQASSASDAAALQDSPLTSDGKPTRRGLQNELILLYIEHPEAREDLAEKFKQVRWDTEDLQKLADALCQEPRTAETDELYALSMQTAPQAAQALAIGQQYKITGTIEDFSLLLTLLLRELQLIDEIAQAKRAHFEAKTDEDKTLYFKLTVEKQKELATIRERLAEIPKITL